MIASVASKLQQTRSAAASRFAKAIRGAYLLRLLNADRSTLMDVTALRRDGSNLVIKGNIMGSMPVSCILTPSEARSALKLIGFRNAWFLLSLMFRP